MKRLTLYVLILVLAGLAVAATAALRSLPVAPPAETLTPEQAFKRHKTWDYDQPRQPLSVLELHLARCTADAAARRQVAERLAAVIADPKSPAGTRQFACRWLPLVASHADVPLLAKLLTDPAAARLGGGGTASTRTASSNAAVLDPTEGINRHQESQTSADRGVPSSKKQGTGPVPGAAAAERTSPGKRTKGQ